MDYYPGSAGKGEERTMEHTKTPYKWIDGEESTHKELVILDNEGEDSILYHGADWAMEEANAQFIVKACNAHEELVEAVKIARSKAPNPGYGIDFKYYNNILTTLED